MKLANGQVVLEQRKNTPFFYARVKTGDGKWITRSTGQTDIKQAGQTALAWLVSPEVSKKNTLEVYIHRYTQSLDGENHQKPIYKEYRAIIRNWLLPYFVDKVCDKINSQTITDYRQWVEKRKGKTLAKATLNCHYVPLRAIFRLAHEAGDMPAVPALSIKNVGKAMERRDTIPPGHYALLLRAARKWWCEAEHPSYTAVRRRLLIAYMQFVAGTGCRPGTEIGSIRWCDLKNPKIVIPTGPFRNLRAKSAVLEIG